MSNDQKCHICAVLEHKNLLLLKGKFSSIVIDPEPFNFLQILIVQNDHGIGTVCRQSCLELETFQNLTLDFFKEELAPDGFNIGSISGVDPLDHNYTKIIPRFFGDVDFMTTIGKTRVIKYKTHLTPQFIALKLAKLLSSILKN